MNKRTEVINCNNGWGNVNDNKTEHQNNYTQQHVIERNKTVTQLISKRILSCIVIYRVVK